MWIFLYTTYTHRVRLISSVFEPITDNEFAVCRNKNNNKNRQMDCIKCTKFRIALFNFNMHLSFSNQNTDILSGL